MTRMLKNKIPHYSSLFSFSLSLSIYMYVSHIHLFYCKIIILFKLDSHYFTLFLKQGLFIRLSNLFTLYFHWTWSFQNVVINIIITACNVNISYKGTCTCNLFLLYKIQLTCLGHICELFANCNDERSEYFHLIFLEILNVWIH